MELNGFDIVIEGTPPSKGEICQIIREFWPDLVVEDDGGDFFVYQDQSAKDIWDGSKLPGSPTADMLYFLPRENELTIVIDNGRELEGLALKVAEKVGTS